MSKIFEAMDKIRRQRELGSRAPREHPQGPVPIPVATPRVFASPPSQFPENGGLEPSEEPSDLNLDVADEFITVKDGEFGSPDPHLVSLVKPGSFESERYRTLRHKVEERKREGIGLVVAVTSPTHNDGKTMTSLNLAGALAQEREGRVLVIDADLRQPKIARYLRENKAPMGLGDLVFNQKARLADAIRYHRRYNLNVLAALSPASSPYEILKSESIGALLGDARRNFDYVILDLPPLTYPDCQVLEKNVDAVLMVVAADRTPRKLIESGRDSLDSTKLLGLVFNRDRERLGGHYYKTPKMSGNGRVR